MKFNFVFGLPLVLALGLTVAACDTKKDATPPAATTTAPAADAAKPADATAPAAAPAAATPAPAADATKPADATAPAAAPAAKDFAGADADKNGSVSLTEAQAVWPKLTQDQFNAADTDKNGSLSADEYAALAKAPPA